MTKCDMVQWVVDTGGEGHQDPAGQRNTTGEEDMNSVPNRGTILLKAREIINGERQDQYGNPEDCFELIGQLWTIYMTHKQRQAGALLGFIGRKDVAMMMVLFKLAREMNGAGKEDNLIDAAGYLGLAGDMQCPSK